MLVTAGGYGRAKSLLFAAVVALWALGGSLGVSACAFDGCRDGCSSGLCMPSPAEAAGAEMAPPGCTCAMLQSPATEAVTASSDAAVTQPGTAWPAAVPSVAQVAAPPRPCLPHPELRPRKPLAAAAAITGWRAPPSA